MRPGLVTSLIALCLIASPFAADSAAGDRADEASPEPTEEEPAVTCEGNVHIVEEGEFPANIAPLYDLTIEELMAANPGIDPTTLQIGDCLNLP